MTIYLRPAICEPASEWIEVCKGIWAKRVPAHVEALVMPRVGRELQEIAEYQETAARVEGERPSHPTAR